jgi:hypothetical protein
VASYLAGVQPEQLPEAAGTATEREVLDSHYATRQAGQDRQQDRAPRSICDVPTGGGRGAPWPVPSDSGSDTAIRSDPPEGRADMTGCKTGQPNESGRGDAVTIDTSGTKRLCRHPECRFAPLDSTSVVVPSGIPKLELPKRRRYIGSQESGAVAGKVIWEMSAQEVPL